VVDNPTPPRWLAMESEMAGSGLRKVTQPLNAKSGQHHARGDRMSIVGWILLGLIAGWIASKIVDKTGQGFLLDIVLGIVGAIVGGYLFALVGAEGITGFNLYSMVVAVIGAVIVLIGYHALTGRRAI
jgi:uncharacterized membrane protein YeaQ/YmgE (transglycosylase-associated protein family)